MLRVFQLGSILLKCLFPTIRPINVKRFLKQTKQRQHKGQRVLFPMQILGIKNRQNKLAYDV
jgi:hypothetical protein